MQKRPFSCQCYPNKKKYMTHYNICGGTYRVFVITANINKQHIRATPVPYFHTYHVLKFIHSTCNMDVGCHLSWSTSAIELLYSWAYGGECFSQVSVLPMFCHFGLCELATFVRGALCLEG